MTADLNRTPIPPRPPLAPLAYLRWTIVEPIVREVAPSRILEVGTGLGGFGTRLAAMADYVGLEQDPTSFAVAEARIGSAGGRMVLGSLPQIEEQTFDLICAFEVLEHIEDDRAALIEWAARLQPGGSILLSVPAGTHRYGAWDEAVGHFRRYTARSLREVIEAAGLDTVRMVHYGWPLGYVTEGVRNFLAGRRRRAGTGSTVSMADRTASSGRSLQPRDRTGRLVRLAASPFARLQRRRPQMGVGLVVLAARPAE
ncbi:MAG TPA: class I SAM-dependent methyltransferase [Acidimicrobiales bacterium]|nr:class I SAM-dependent methyltransferase [Acidimicrobiales bacterium]